MGKFVVAVVMSLVFNSGFCASKTILVLGDSISAAYGIEVGQGWVNLVQSRLQRENPNYNMVNDSISGDTTAGGLARIDAALSEHKPAVLVLELGANDGLRGLPPAQMKANLAAIISKAKSVGAKVLLLSMRIPPNYGKRYTDLFYKTYTDLAQELNIAFAPFILEDVALVKKLMQDDGLHPNAEAQPLIVDAIWPHLTPLLQ